MKLKVINLIFFIYLFNYSGLAQNLKLNRKTDSLKSLLASAKNKTDQISLRIQIGKHSGIKSPGYWDSLLTDTRLYKLPLYQCKVLDELGLIYRNTNRELGLEYIKNCVALAEEKGYKKELLTFIKHILLFYRGGDHEKTVLDWSYKGLKIAEDLRDKQSEVDFYSYIATQYFFVDDIQRALKMHFNCLRLYKELHDTINIAGTLTDIGSDYHAIGDKAKTCYYYLEAGKYLTSLGETVYAAYIYNSLGAAYLTLSQADSGYKYSVLAYRINQKLNIKQGIASSLLNIAAYYSLKKKFRAAEKNLLEAYQIARNADFSAQLPDIALSLKLLYLKEKNYKKALEASDLYISLKDSMSNEKKRKQALEREFAYTFEKKENENKLLAKQTQIQQLQLDQNRYLFICVGSLLLVVLASIYLFSRQRRIRSEQENLKLEQKLLRSQMNPHFIFNSLNSIQQFIVSQQNVKAEKYLSKFSRLVRELLESNIKESISIKEETDILKGYLEMESLRFRKSFSFSILIDENINQEFEHIPHMMIQPFVENAIWHGLLPKESEGSLQITLEKTGDENTIRCIIDDNGIGREEAMKKEATFKRKSLALSLVRQRMELMHQHLKVNCGINIVDKVDYKGESTGTKIILVLPLLVK